LAARIGTFAVPEIVDSTQTSITFHRYEPSFTVSQLLTNDYPRALRLAARVAALIVALQDGLAHDVGVELPIEELKLDHRSTFVHGDFTPDNLLVHRDQLVAIDWSSSHWVPGPFNRAPDHWDLIWFVQCMYVRDFAGRLTGGKRDAYCRELVAQYHRQRPDLDLAALADQAITMNRYFERHILKAVHSPPSRLRHRPRWIAFRRFWRRYRS
jgi:serine/threonine protein kinase